MAAKNFMPERTVAQTENEVSENGEEIREQVRKKNLRDLHGEPTHSGRVHARMRRVHHAVSCIRAWSITIFRCLMIGCPAPGLRMASW